MKRILSASLIAMFCIASSNTAHSQSFTTVGNVALANPDIDMIEFNTLNSNIRGIRGKTHDYFQIFSHQDHDNGPSLFMYSHGTTNPAFLSKRGGLSLWSTNMQGYSQDDDMAFELLTHPIQFGGGSLGSPQTLFYINKIGQVGIGTTNFQPENKLTVNGDIGFEQSSDIRGIRGETENYLEIFTNHDHENGPAVFMYGHATTNPAYTGNRGGFSLWSSFVDGHSQNSDMAFELLNHTISHGGGSLGSPIKLFKIDKDGDIILKNNTDNTNYNAIKGNSNVSGMALYGNADWSDGAGILLNGKSSQHGAIDFVVPEDASGSEAAYTFRLADANNDWTNNLMSIHKNGKVRIGDPGININTTNEYKLYVEKGILTEKVKIALVSAGQWSDFVFADDYNLKTLDDVEQFISKNKHLPDVPSASEVEKNGYDLTIMNATLLQKIEELTLYVIQQQKEINELRKKMN